jgi:hypothetical protein
MLTRKELETLEEAWLILDHNRHCGDFNESHDLNIGDGARVISEFLNYQNQMNGSRHTARLTAQIQTLESFRNL